MNKLSSLKLNIIPDHKFKALELIFVPLMINHVYLMVLLAAVFTHVVMSRRRFNTIL